MSGSKGKQQNSTKNHEITNKKSVFTAYLLWLFGGIFGAHHFYLNRDRHAFLWWCTLGGYFGIGWMYEIFKIPSYVRDANEDKEFVDKFNAKLRKFPKPPFSTIRFLGAIMVGYMFGELIKQAIPEDLFFGIDWSFLHWLSPLGIAIGIWIVGNVGREKGVFWHCLIAAYLAYPVRYYIYDDSWSMITILFISALVFDTFSKQWRTEKREKKSLCKRTITFSFAITIYLSLWCCYFYFNGKVVDSEGDEIPVHEAIKNILSSPIWSELKESFSETYKYAQHKGWYAVLKELFSIMDDDGLEKAYKTLNLSAAASQAEITAAYRKLSKENHPDKQHEEDKRKEFQERFMEIQQAYELLSKRKMKRKSRNKKFNDDL